MTEERLPLTDLKRASYELFVFGLSLIAVANTILIQLEFVSDLNVEVLTWINFVLALFFLGDFALRFARAGSGSRYFFRGFGWADLLSGVPIPLFQLFRASRLTISAIALRRLGGRSLLREIGRNRAGGALYGALILAVVLVQLASTAIVTVEAGNPAANIKTAGDAIWWAYVTITTVGYGDYYPVTQLGRVIGVLVMTIGVGLFGVLSGFLANAFLGNTRNDRARLEAANKAAALPASAATTLSQMTDLQTLLAQQEANFAELRRRVEAMDAQLRQAGIDVDAGGATIRSDAVQPE